MTTFAVLVAAAALAVEAQRACGSLRGKKKQSGRRPRKTKDKFRIIEKEFATQSKRWAEAHMLCTRRANIVSMARVCRAEREADSGFLVRRLKDG
jgi:hypothetical protein